MFHFQQKSITTKPKTQRKHYSISPNIPLMSSLSGTWGIINILIYINTWQGVQDCISKSDKNDHFLFELKLIIDLQVNLYVVNG